jgi:hypothetical protein
MSKSDYEFGKSFLYNIQYIGGRLPMDHNFQLGGTPTVSALYEMSYLIREFRESTNVQVCHTVILTDGEAGDGVGVNRDFMSVARPEIRYWNNNTAGVMDDPITGASYDIQRVFDHSKYKDGVAPLWRMGSVAVPEDVKHIDVWIACDIIRRRTQSQLHWISLSERESFSASSFGMEMKGGVNWKRDGFARGDVAGFDSTTVVSTRKFASKTQYRASAPVVGMSKTQLQKSFFESQTAAGGLKIVATLIGERLGTS